MVCPSGRRTELRQIGTGSIYEAADSSYLQLQEVTGGLRLNTTDGIQLLYGWFNSEFRCTQVIDRNGNYLSINYNALGQPTNITDTLGRVINFNYDSNANLLSITQDWSGQTHTWASFQWSTQIVPTTYSGAQVVGAGNVPTPVITQVGFPDGSRFNFEYNSNAQLGVLRRYTSDNVQRQSTTFSYSTSSGDIPRLTSTGVQVHNWTGINGVPATVTTGFHIEGNAHVLTAPDGTVYKEFFGTGWQKGLVTTSETLVAGDKKKWTTTSYTQDDTLVVYKTNPRVSETNIHDPSGNRRRTTINYTTLTLPSGAPYSLPTDVNEYEANGTTLYRRTHTDYVTTVSAYLNRRMISLPESIKVYDGSNNLMAKTGYWYDWNGEYLVNTVATPTQHHSSYNTDFTQGRGNLTQVMRFDISDQNNELKGHVQRIAYDINGSVVFTRDAMNRQTSMSYADSFSDSVNRNTFAYLTTVTDPAGFSSHAKYKFEFGAKTRTEGAPPAGHSEGTIQTTTYDSIGRLERTTVTNTGAYTRFWYGPDYTASYATINSLADEAYAIKVFDGAGRAIGEATNHPGSAGGYRLVNTIYDVMGRVAKRSNPTEVNSSWVPAGHDAVGIYYTQQTYDWQGRPLVTTNTDGTYRTAVYSGCGCAGGEVVTLLDEGTIDPADGATKRRKQKFYADVFGRNIKTEVFNWHDGGVYSTRTQRYNVRDQVVSIKQYSGLESSGISQEIEQTYDNYGRLQTRKAPVQSSATSYTYYADDRPHVATDGRGASTTVSYNSRGLISTISYGGPAPVPSSISYLYDAAGNRTSMTDEAGSVSYAYNSLSQLTSETRQFSGLSGSFQLSYEYRLGGQLKAVTDHTGSRVEYAYDSAARLSGITGSGPGSASIYASNFVYRASGAIRDFDFGGMRQYLGYNSRLQNTVNTLSNSSISVTWNYEYYADGKIRQVSDSNDNRFDRRFNYDHVGRLKEVKTGTEARGGTAADGPFYNSYTYDVWENTTAYTNRIWTQTTSETITYTNNKRQPWFYDAAGNMWADFNTNYNYDAAGRQYGFSANSYVGGGSQSVLEVTQLFDGQAQPVKKVTTNRWEEFLSEEPTVQESTDTVYYLRSSVLGGQIVAELSQTGLKTRGFVYAGGMRLATQYPDSSGGSVSWTMTSPVSGSEYIVEGSNFFRTELDPLGTDVTNPPQQGVVVEPVFYNDKFSHLPLEYEWGPSDEAHKNMNEWASLVAFTWANVAEANRAADLWQRGDRDAAIEILTRNPNIGVQDGSGNSRFGRQAINFLNGLDHDGSELMGQLNTGPGNEGQENDQQKFLTDSLEEAKKRISEDPNCAKLFGGEKNALKKLKELKFRFSSLNNRGIAEIKGKNVTLDSERFNGEGAMLTFATNITKTTTQGFPTISFNRNTLHIKGSSFGAFVLLHELGHRTNIFGEFDKDGGSQIDELSTGANNEKVRASCFSELTPVPAPLIR